MVLRPFEPGDTGFICSSFLSSFRAASTHAEGLTGKQAVRLLTNLIRNDWGCTVADMDGVIGGWIVHNANQHLGWVFTREMFRRQGMAKLLIKSVGIDMGKPVISPFTPNRIKETLPLRLQIRHRPFLCLTEPLSA